MRLSDDLQQPYHNGNGPKMVFTCIAFLTAIILLVLVVNSKDLVKEKSHKNKNNPVKSDSIQASKENRPYSTYPFSARKT